MDGKDKLKELRVNSGYTIRAFALLMDMSPAVVFGYESGQKSITSIPVYRAVEMFDLFHVSLYDFLHEHYDLEAPLCGEIVKDTPNDAKVLLYEINKLEKRIHKNFERKKIEPDMAAELFSMLSLARENPNDDPPVDVYEKYVCPVSYLIKKTLKPINPSLPEANQLIIDGLYRKDLSYDLLAQMCGVNYDHVRKSIQKMEGVWHMHVGLVYRICYLLGLQFEEIFSIQNCKNAMKKFIK